MSNAAPVVAAMAAGFRNCYSQALAQHPGAEGKVLLSINIGPSGAVQSVNAVPSGSLPESVVDCTKSRGSESDRSFTRSFTCGSRLGEPSRTLLEAARRSSKFLCRWGSSSRAAAYTDIPEFLVRNIGCGSPDGC